MVAAARAVAHPLIRGLRSSEVHVWFASLAPSAAPLEKRSASLSSRELERAARFHRPLDRERFAAAHGIARAILGEYTGIAPGKVHFDHDPSGKPFIDHPDFASTLGFNMSHSGAEALYAVSLGRSIGVDIELVDPNLIDEDTSKQITAPNERAMLDGLEPGARIEALFRLWVLKEAFLKARGRGLSIPPVAVDVSAAFRRPTHTLPTIAGPRDGAPCALVSLLAPPGYAAAAAFTGSPGRVVCRRFRSFT